MIATSPDARHLFQEATTGGASEYAELPLELLPSLLETFATWFERYVPVEDQPTVRRVRARATGGRSGS